MSEPIDPHEVAVYCEQFFGADRRGQKVFEYLLQRFARPPVLKGGIDAVLQTYYNDGARAVLDHLLQLVEAGRRPEQVEPDAD